MSSVIQLRLFHLFSHHHVITLTLARNNLIKYNITAKMVMFGFRLQQTFYLAQIWILNWNWFWCLSIYNLFKSLKFVCYYKAIYIFYPVLSARTSNVSQHNSQRMFDGGRIEIWGQTDQRGWSLMYCANRYLDWRVYIRSVFTILNIEPTQTGRG